MNILITGGAGFIGSNLAEALLAEGHRIAVVDNLSTGRYENVKHLADLPNFTFHKGNVTNKSFMDGLVAEADQVYHLAAPVGVKYIMENPVLTILDNVRGIDVMLELAHRHHKRILVASTSEVYGRSLDLLDPTGTRKLKEGDYRVEGSTENHRWAYANTKAMDEFLALAYHKEYYLETVIVRFFNTVGPRQLSVYGMVIPNFVQAALRHQPIRIFGTGEQKRSFLHVNDAVRAVTTLMNTEAAIGQVFNVGNPFEVTINELAQRIIQLADSKSTIEYVSYEEAYGKGFEDMNRRTADITKLTETIGFQIQYDLNSIVTDVIDHYRSRN